MDFTTTETKPLAVIITIVHIHCFRVFKFGFKQVSGPGHFNDESTDALGGSQALICSEIKLFDIDFECSFEVRYH